MSTSQTIDELTNARDAIRAKMIAAGQAGSSDKLSVLAENLLIEKIQQETMPTANADRLGKIYQYVGTTTNTYTNGYWYKCVENSGVYSYVEIEVESPGILNIQDNGTDMTYEDSLNFIGFDVDDDSANGSTDVAAHELTPAEMAEIVTPLPGVPVDLPILFDESGAERIVGWYKYSDGTKQPVYEKDFSVKTPTTAGSLVKVADMPANVSKVLFVYGRLGVGVNLNIDVYSSSNWYCVTQVGTLTIKQDVNGYTNQAEIITVRYIKSTDTPS